MSRANLSDQTIDINLSEILPFEVNLDKNKSSLIITKGVMSGTISIDSLNLELEKNFSTITEFEYLLTKNNLLLKLQATSLLNIEEINSVIQQTVSSELSFNLTNLSTKKPLSYITNDYFGFPLIGSMYFGVIDRGTNLLQIRSITGCPLNCPFCSVDEGPASKTKIRDFIVDTDYLVDTYNYLVEQKGLKEAEAHLDGQGEPMAYPYLPELVQKLNQNKHTKIVSIQTNGWFLNEKLIDELAEVKLSRINLSINAITPSLSKKLAGRGTYNIDKILEQAEYIINSNISLLIAPIWLPGINDEEMEKIIRFSLEKNNQETVYPTLGIQNYLVHDEGRNLKGVKQQSFKDFYGKLRNFEEKLGAKNLVLKTHMFNMKKSPMLPVPMKRNEIVTAEIVLPGRLQDEVFAKAKNRIIHVSNASNLSIGRTAKVRIIRNRHNIFFGVPV